MRSVLPQLLLRLALASTVTIIVSGSRPVRADSGADEADVRFQRGTALYKAGRFDEALVEFFASNRLAANRNVVFNIARSYEALRKYEQAYRYYAEYIASESDPGERTAAQRRLKELAPQVALLRIESTPPGATVYLDRKDLGGRGQTPLLIAHPPGQVQILVELPGHKLASKKVSIERGRETKAALSLELIVGTLTIDATPAARVYVDRAEGDTPSARKATTTPASLHLPPGRHSIELEADGYRAQRRDVVIRADGETTLRAVLEERPPASGTVVLASTIKGALVVVDGIERGFTPAVLDLPVGDHEVEVKNEGYGVWRRTVTVDNDGRSFYQVELSDLEREVTAATRTQQSVSTAPASITLIHRPELWAFGYQKLTEALRGVRGYYDSDDRNYESLGVRGFSRPGDYTNRILLSRDGHTMNDNWIGSAPVGRDFAVDLQDVSRIEVVRGPGSTFYGQGAFFGVVNVVSLAPGEGPPVRAGGAADSEGGGSVFAHGATSSGPVAISMHASAQDTTGRSFEFEEFSDTPSGGVIEGSDGESAQRGAIRLRAGEFSLDAGYNRRLKDVPTASYETVFDPENNPSTEGVLLTTNDRRGFAEARWDRRRQSYNLGARVAYDHQKYDGVYPYDDGMEAFVVGDAGSGNWVTGEGRAQVNLLRQWITIGGEVASHQVNQSVDDESDGMNEFDDRQEFVNAAVYAVDEVRFSKRASLTAGVRFDRFGEQEDTALSPRVGAVARPYGTAVTKLVFGRAYRSPSVYELYYNDGGLTQIAPESLDPETVWSGELEHTHPIGGSSYLLGSVFANQIEGLISLVSNEDDVLVQVNSQDDVRTVGGELEARVAAETGAWVGAAVSYTRFDTDDAAATINSAELVSSLRGFWPVTGDQLALASEWLYTSPRERRDGLQTGHAVIGSLFLSGRLGARGLRYRAGVTNLLDWDWSVAVGEEFVQQSIRQNPRTFMAELVYQHE